MEERKTSGNHTIFKRSDPPAFTLSIQDDDGKAKPYQVDQLLNKVRELGLYNFKEED